MHNKLKMQLFWCSFLFMTLKILLDFVNVKSMALLIQKYELLAQKEENII